jgi:Uncharacterized conserved protein
VESVKRFLLNNRVDAEFRVFEQSTKNSQLAANALGCSVSQIAKSIVFLGERVYVVVISGDKRVDTNKLSQIVGERVRIATPEEVYKFTGYKVGGVPPFPHKEEVKVLLDSSLKRFAYVWAAAGCENALFKIEVNKMFELLGAKEVDVAITS